MLFVVGYGAEAAGLVNGTLVPVLKGGSTPEGPVPVPKLGAEADELVRVYTTVDESTDTVVSEVVKVKLTILVEKPLLVMVVLESS